MIPPSIRSSNEDSVLVRAVSLPELGRSITYVDHGGTAACLCFNSESEEVLLVNQQRPVLGLSLIELPSGRVEDGERPEEAAARELLEETGYRAGTLTLLGSFFSSVGLTNERIYIFSTDQFVCDDSSAAELGVKWTSLSQCLELIVSGDLVDAKTALGIHLLTASRDKLGYGQH